MKGRRAILQAHAHDKPIEGREDALDLIAQTTPGMSGADLANLMNEAAILCAQQDATTHSAWRIWNPRATKCASARNANRWC